MFIHPLMSLFFLLHRYTVTITFVLINMFVSILTQSFAEVQENIHKQKNDHEMVEFVIKRFKVLMEGFTISILGETLNSLTIVGDGFKALVHYQLVSS